jgi:hypothetical protein
MSSSFVGHVDLNTQYAAGLKISSGICCKILNKVERIMCKGEETASV